MLGDAPLELGALLRLCIRTCFTLVATRSLTRDGRWRRVWLALIVDVLILVAIAPCLALLLAFVRARERCRALRKKAAVYLDACNFCAR